MALGPRRTPERQSPMFSGVLLPTYRPLLKTLTTAGGVITLTAAELQSGLITVDCDDAQTLTTPTATDLNAGIPGVAVGTAFFVDIINYGDTTLTIGLGTGVTKTTIHTVAAVLTIVTLAAKRLLFVCTGVNGVMGATSDSWNVYAFGSTAAAVA